MGNSPSLLQPCPSLAHVFALVGDAIESRLSGGSLNHRGRLFRCHGLGFGLVRENMILGQPMPMTAYLA